MTIADTERWMSDGLCARTRDDAFFDKRNSSGQQHAVAMCTACPVRRTCLAYARTEGVPYGVWGGETEDERSEWWAANGGQSGLFAEVLAGMRTPMPSKAKIRYAGKYDIARGAA